MQPFTEEGVIKKIKITTEMYHFSISPNHLMVKAAKTWSLF